MTIIAAVIISMTAVSLAKVNNLALNTLTSNKTAMQAQQYAAAKADFVKLVKYDELTAQNRTIIQSSNGYQDEVIISPEWLWYWRYSSLCAMSQRCKLADYRQMFLGLLDAFEIGEIL